MFPQLQLQLLDHTCKPQALQSLDLEFNKMLFHGTTTSHFACEGAAPLSWALCTYVDSSVVELLQAFTPNRQ